MSSKRVWINPRPVLVIERAGGSQLGNCYASMSFRVTSLQPLSGEELKKLRDLGLLGYGQEFYFRLEHPVPGAHNDWAFAFVPDVIRNGDRASVPASGFDTIRCQETEDNTGRVIACPSINPYTKLPDPDRQVPYYTYLCESRVDSSD